MALARHLSKDDLLAGRRVVELGCGVGLPSVVALDRGARVTATDHYAAALDFARYNAYANLGFGPKTRLLDWHAPQTDGSKDPFELVLAADVLYERRNVSALVDLIPALLAPGGEALLADPHRKDTPVFVEKMREKGFSILTEEYVVPSNGRRVAILVHRFGRAGTKRKHVKQPL